MLFPKIHTILVILSKKNSYHSSHFFQKIHNKAIYPHRHSIFQTVKSQIHAEMVYKMKEISFKIMIIFFFFFFITQIKIVTII